MHLHIVYVVYVVYVLFRARYAPAGHLKPCNHSSRRAPLGESVRGNAKGWVDGVGTKHAGGPASVKKAGPAAAFS